MEMAIHLMSAAMLMTWGIVESIRAKSMFIRLTAVAVTGICAAAAIYIVIR